MASPLAGLRSALFALDGAEPVTFTPAATGVAVHLNAIRTDNPAGDFNSPGNVKRSIAFEFAKADLATKPVQKVDLIAATDHAGNAESWRVNQVLDQENLASWLVWVERAA